MKKKDSPKRYIYDSLYGAIYFPKYIWDVITCPELQRLREVRLCNINSFCLTGGANINRYEHALGTCYLAQICLEAWPPLNPISEEEQRQFLLAALFHDIRTAAFGHSVQYVDEKYGFNHEKPPGYDVIGDNKESYQYKWAILDPIYFGVPREIPSRVSEEDLKAIGDIVSGKGRLRYLIKWDIDLDNIDNVFRMAYHIGIVKSGEVPLNLARSMWVENDEVIFKKSAIPLLEEWHRVRKELYYLLLLNPEEFSAKCMLTEAIELARQGDSNPIKWNYVDYEFLKNLSDAPPARIYLKELLFNLELKFEKELNKYFMSEELQTSFKIHNIEFNDSSIIEKNDIGWKIKNKKFEYYIEKDTKGLKVFQKVLKVCEISTIVTRLMKGELYGCIGIFSTSKIDNYGEFIDLFKRMQLEEELNKIIRDTTISNQSRLNNQPPLKKYLSLIKSAMVAFHPILDVNKTERQIRIKTEDEEFRTIGTSTNHLLIGVFFKNLKMDMYHLGDYPKDLIARIHQETYNYLVNKLGDSDLKKIELYDEVNKLT
jgi:HD superfamily phosphohydrolase